MEDDIRGKLFPIMVLLTLVFLVTTVRSCGTIQKQKSLKEKEMSAKLDAEEELSEIKKSRDVQILVKDKELQDEKNSHEATRRILDQERLVNKELRSELDKITKVKEVLEEELKDVLVSSKSKNKK